MADPVLVEVTRGGAVESEHRGSAVVMDPDGRAVLALGETGKRIFPRSAVKGLQALCLIETGAADRYELTQAELALACSSHSGEPRHAEAAASMLAKAGRDLTCLECGTHWPSNEQAARALAAAGGEPTALHNNCSGKHSGFVCVACATNVDPKGYVRPDHAVQRRIKGVFEEMMEIKLPDAARGVDGCSIPTYATPLEALALAFARFGSGAKLSRDRAAAARRLREAVAAEPFMVAGSRRFDTIVMGALGSKVFTKTGAEGVYCAALPEQGLGIAIKCDDGAGRAAEAVMASLICSFVPLTAAQQAIVEPYTDKPIVNWNGIETGKLRAAAELRARVRQAAGVKSVA
ncbi:MAG TPA: asparaginase [Beijerinckiaceae bacterium]|jgi:L-asparaginase II|nr:asparaginase [Beijerinckiaceae bacterium]